MKIGYTTTTSLLGQFKISSFKNQNCKFTRCQLELATTTALPLNIYSISVFLIKSKKFYLSDFSRHSRFYNSHWYDTIHHQTPNIHNTHFLKLCEYHTTKNVYTHSREDWGRGNIPSNTSTLEWLT